MSRTIGYVALVLGSIGLAGCTTALVTIWIARPTVLRCSDELLDVLDDGLQIVEQKVTHAVELVGRIQSGLASVPDDIIHLSERAGRDPDDERALKRISNALSEHRNQIDAVAEIGTSAVAFLNKTAQLATSLRVSSRLSSDASAADDALVRAAALARVATSLTEMHEILVKVRTDERVQPAIVDAVVRTARGVEQDLDLVDSKLEQLRQNSIEWRTEVLEMRTERIPRWTNWTAGVASLLAAWMGLGQFVLLRRAWKSVHAAQSP